MTIETGAQLRDHAIERADAAANPAWKECMFDCTVQVAKAQAYFSADDTFELYDTIPDAPTTHELRAYGAIMRRAVKAGICEKSHFGPPSRRKQVHCSPMQIWRSLIYVGVRA